MKKKCKLLLIIFSVVTVTIFVVLFLSELGDYYPAEGKPEDLSQIAADGITEEEFKTLKKQTGLGKSAVEDILKEEKPMEILERFQQQNFKKYDVACEYMFFPVTKLETLKDENGKSVKLELPKLKSGDILVTKSTHTLIFRHGHAGLVTNADASEVLEAMMIGTNSTYSNLASWKRYPSVAVLRPKNLSEEEIKSAIEYAEENLHDVKYDLTAGLFDKKIDIGEGVNKTHCSHLVWAAYKAVGIDIDSNGGMLILPEDFLESDELEVIWSYGINLTK